MAWTTPKTWSVGETVTAAMLNTHVRDNLDYLHTRRTESGRETIGSSGDATVNFATAFSATPVVTGCVGSALLGVLFIDSIFTDSFNVRLRTPAGGTVGGIVNWIAEGLA